MRNRPDECPVRVSIGVPAYNEAGSLPHLLESLRLQQVPGSWGIELLLVANGCTDRTVEVALDFGEGCFGPGGPRRSRQGALRWWHFGRGNRRMSVCEAPEARKSLALNLIHEHASGEIVLLFDADVQAAPHAVRSLCQSLLDHPGHGAVGAGYVGDVPPPRRSGGPAREWCRVRVCRAINGFDRSRPRLDGKGCGYRRDLVSEHPAISAADLWLEGLAWERSDGCLYVPGAVVRYRLPDSFEELAAQYARFAQVQDEFAERYPQLLSAIRRGRRRAGGRVVLRPHPLNRLVGWLFFRWVRRRARCAAPLDGDRWQVVSSTKWDATSREVLT